jgi:transcriptional regulator with XRE-family HTH domain
MTGVAMATKTERAEKPEKQNTYGRVLAVLREARGLTVKELAHRTSLNVNLLRRIEADEAVPIGKDVPKLESQIRGLREYRHLIRLPKPVPPAPPAPKDILTLRIETAEPVEPVEPVEPSEASGPSPDSPDTTGALLAAWEKERAERAAAPIPEPIPEPVPEAAPPAPEPEPPKEPEPMAKTGIRAEQRVLIAASRKKWADTGHKWLKSQREKMALGTLAIAAQFGVHHVTWSTWESGNPKHSPSEATQERLAEFFKGKTCTSCGKRKPLKDYRVRSDSPDGRQPYCRECASGIDAKYRGRKARGETAKRGETPEPVKDSGPVDVPAKRKKPAAEPGAPGDLEAIAAALPKALAAARDAADRLAKLRGDVAELEIEAEAKANEARELAGRMQAALGRLNKVPS